VEALRVRAQYTKVGDLRFISHLDLTRVMERAVNRAELPIAYSEGFHPMPKIAYGPALALGIISRVELVDFFFSTPLLPSEVQSRLNRVLPAECQVLRTAAVPTGQPALTALIDRASYLVRVDLQLVPEANTLPAKTGDILERDSIIVTRQKKGKTRRVEIRPYLLNLSANLDGPVAALEFSLRIGSDGATNPREVLGLFNLDLSTPGVLVERTELTTENGVKLFNN